jgi:hypothetical protein
VYEQIQAAPTWVTILIPLLVVSAILDAVIVNCRQQAPQKWTPARTRLWRVD